MSSSLRNVKWLNNIGDIVEDGGVVWVRIYKDYEKTAVGEEVLQVPKQILSIPYCSKSETLGILWFCSFLRMRWFIGTKNESGWVQIHSKFLRSMIHSRNVRTVIDLLSNEEIIDIDQGYKIGCRTKQYKLSEKALGRSIRLVVKSKSLSRKLREWRQKKEEKLRSDPALAYMIDVMHCRMSFDVDGAFHAFQSMNLDGGQELYWEESIQKMEDRDFHFAVDSKTGRFFSNVTNLPKELRPFLRLDGEPLIEIDVKCCQPYLLTGLYTDSADGEREKFLSWIIDSDFYTKLGKAAGLTDFDRDELKRRIFIDVLFDKPFRRPLWAAFQSEFPRLAKQICETKVTDHRKLALKLQSMEAKAIIYGVVPELAMENIPVLTIHDSCMVKAKDVILAKALLKDHMQATSHCPIPPVLSC